MNSEKIDDITKLKLYSLSSHFLKFKNLFYRSKLHRKILLNFTLFFYVFIYKFFRKFSKEIFHQNKFESFFIKIYFVLRKIYFLLNIYLYRTSFLKKRKIRYPLNIAFLNYYIEIRIIVSFFLIHTFLNFFYVLPKSIVSPELTKKKVKRVKRDKFFDTIIPSIFKSLPLEKQRKIIKRKRQEHLKKKLFAGLRRRNFAKLGIGRRKKRNRKLGFLFLHITNRNFKVTFSDKRGKVKAFYSSGTNRKYRKSRRRLNDAKQKAMFRMTLEIHALKYRRVILIFKQGFFDDIIKVLRRRRIRAIAHYLSYNKPHNGCRKPNKKRK
jgi:ribosomal protein S11